MALQIKHDFNGIALPAAYVRIDRVFGGKREGWTALVSIYASAEAAASGAPLEQFNHGAGYVADQHPLPALYAALKDDERFKGAVDA